MRYPQPATITRLRSKPAQIEAEKAQTLRQLVLSFDLPPEPVSRIVAAIDRQTAAEQGWTFAMVSADQNAAVVGWIAENSARPIVAVRLWAQLFRHLRHDTAEVIATRAELAGDIGVRANDVSRVMTELARINAVVRHREGGRVRYFINPNVATKLTGAQRDMAQQAIGPLRLVQTRADL